MVVVASATELLQRLQCAERHCGAMLSATKESTRWRRVAPVAAVVRTSSTSLTMPFWLIIEIGDVPEQPHSEGSLEDRRRVVGIRIHRLMSEASLARPTEDRNACLFDRSLDITVRADPRDVLARNAEW